MAVTMWIKAHIHLRQYSMYLTNCVPSISVFIEQGVTECYECQPKPTQKTFPGCTIRNTPSEPIHCIVWAKHLFK